MRKVCTPGYRENIPVEGFIVIPVENYHMPIYCDNSGFQNRDLADFCKECGKKILSTTESGTLQAGALLNKNSEIKNLIKSERI